MDCCVNRLLKQPTVEAIPKAEYEARLKADIEAILDKIRAEIKNDWQLKKSPCSPFSCGLRQAIEIIDKYREEVHRRKVRNKE